MPPPPPLMLLPILQQLRLSLPPAIANNSHCLVFWPCSLPHHMSMYLMSEVEKHNQDDDKWEMIRKVEGFFVLFVRKFAPRNLENVCVTVAADFFICF